MYVRKSINPFDLMTMKITLWWHKLDDTPKIPDITWKSVFYPRKRHAFLPSFSSLVFPLIALSFCRVSQVFVVADLHVSGNPLHSEHLATHVSIVTTITFSGNVLVAQHPK